MGEIIHALIDYSEDVIKEFNKLDKEAELNPILLTHLREAKLNWLRQHIASKTNKTFEEVGMSLDEQNMDDILRIINLLHPERNTPS